MSQKLSQKIAEAKRPRCERCNHIKPVVLRRNVASNGVNQFFWWCSNCEKPAIKGSKLIGHEVINHWINGGLLRATVDDIPVVNDYSTKQFCEVCGVQGAEVHHFAPQALADLFGDNWYLWPVAYLCKPHHDLWHSVVTFYMPGPAVPHPEMLARYGGSHVSIR